MVFNISSIMGCGIVGLDCEALSGDALWHLHYVAGFLRLRV